MHGALPVLFPGHIQMDVDRLATQFRDFCRHPHSIHVEQVADDHLGPFLGEESGLSRSLTTGSPANQGNLSVHASQNTSLAREIRWESEYLHYTTLSKLDHTLAVCQKF